jgi:hypothetical protein
VVLDSSPLFRSDGSRKKAGTRALFDPGRNGENNGGKLRWDCQNWSITSNHALELGELGWERH